MPRNMYEPLKLNQTNRYAGYQFHALIRLDRMTPADGFRYLALTVCSWARQRMPESDRDVPELALPEAERYAEAGNERFVPYHFSIGYSLDITPLMEEGIWTLRLKEPDGGIEGERDAVPGRFFTTRVGLRLNEKGYTELGIRIDVTDPANAEEEVAFAFRPGFVRTLAIQPFVHMEQAREMKYGQAVRVDTDEEYRRLLYMLDNEENQLPLVIFTHCRPGEKKPAPGMSMEDFVRNEQAGSLLRFAGAGKDFPGMPEAGGAVSASADPVMPFDTEKFSRSSFAYAVTYVLGDGYFDRFAARARKSFRPGDILLCGPRRFRGGIAAAGPYTGDGEARIKKAYDAALLAAQSWSKHKAQYSFGTVVFEAEARKMAQEREFQRILASGQMAEKEKYERLVRHAEEQQAVIDGKDAKIARLEKQCEEEYARGMAFRDREYETLEEENSGLRKELGEKQEQIDRMQSGYQQAKDVLAALDSIRKTGKMPSGNADVVQYFARVYPDRIGFTARGAAEAAKSRLRSDHLWEILFMIATDLVDVFRSAQGNLTEEEAMRVTGCEISFHEGSMTRRDSDLMRLRDDEYEGKTISVEPHLKLKSAKGEPSHQRLHFCYDPELRMIIIGYVGDHLESAATRYANNG